jgi:hypothetical protein
LFRQINCFIIKSLLLFTAFLVETLCGNTVTLFSYLPAVSGQGNVNAGQFNNSYGVFTINPSSLVPGRYGSFGYSQAFHRNLSLLNAGSGSLSAEIPLGRFTGMGVAFSYAAGDIYDEMKASLAFSFCNDPSISAGENLIRHNELLKQYKRVQRRVALDRDIKDTVYGIPFRTGFSVGYHGMKTKFNSNVFSDRELLVSAGLGLNIKNIIDLTVYARNLPIVLENKTGAFQSIERDNWDAGVGLLTGWKGRYFRHFGGLSFIYFHMRSDHRVTASFGSERRYNNAVYVRRKFYLKHPFFCSGYRFQYFITTDIKHLLNVGLMVYTDLGNAFSRVRISYGVLYIGSESWNNTASHVISIRYIFYI